LLPANPLPDNRPRQLTTAWWVAWLLLIGFFALAFRWYYIGHAIVDTPIQGDAVQYHAYAWNLVNHGIFSQSAPGSDIVVADSFRDPGYPAFVAVWIAILGDFPAWYPGVLYTQAVLGALTVLLLLCAARRWLPDRWLIAAGIAMALWPHSVTITSYVLSETLLSFLCALGIFFFSRTTGRRSAISATASGLAFGAAGLTNAVVLPFAPLLALGLMRHKAFDRKVLIVLLASALALPALWAVRNIQIPSSASSSHRAIMNLVQGSWPEYHISYYRKLVHHDPESVLMQQKIDDEYQNFRADPMHGATKMAARMAQQPLHYLGWYLRKPALLWGWSIRIGEGDIYVFQTPYSPFKENATLRLLVSLCHAFNPLLLILMVAGCVLTFLRRALMPPGALGVAALLFLVTLVYGILQSEPRYSIPYRGEEILLATFGMQATASWLAARRRQAKAA